MPAATPSPFFQTLFQHEVLRIISTQNAGSFCLHHNHQSRWQYDLFNVFLKIFWTKGHKIVEILALLTTELSNSKIYKVGMLFAIL